MAGLTPSFSLSWLYLRNPEPKGDQRLRGYARNIYESIHRQVAGILLATMMTFVVLYGAYLAYFPLLLESSFGSSSFVIGLVMSSMSFSTALASSQLGRITRILSQRTLVKAAFCLYALALALMPRMPSLWALLLPTVLFGIAQGINIPSLQTLLAGFAPVEHRAALMSINGTVLRLGQTLGPPVVGIPFGLWGLEGAFVTGVIISLVMFGLTYALLR